MDYQVVVGEEELEDSREWLRSLVEKHLQPGETLMQFIDGGDQQAVDDREPAGGQGATGILRE